MDQLQQQNFRSDYANRVAFEHIESNHPDLYRIIQKAIPDLPQK